MRTGAIQPFAVNYSGFAASYTGAGGLERPIDVEFGPDGAMYAADFGLDTPEKAPEYHSNTGVIWKISRK